MIGYPGVNIQYPISRLIVDGLKTIETRTYPLPKKYVGKKMLIVETPGKLGNFKARIVAVVVFGESFKYQTDTEFYADTARHYVDHTTDWAWEEDKGKWGWPITSLTPLPIPQPVPKRIGIKFTAEIHI